MPENKYPVRGAGPFTPMTTPVEVGEKSGGELQLEESSATPIADKDRGEVKR